MAETIKKGPSGRQKALSDREEKAVLCPDAAASETEAKEKPSIRRWMGDC